MSSSVTRPFTTSGNYTKSDASLVEVSDGKGILTYQEGTNPANSTFGATFTNNVNGSWGDGTLTGTLGSNSSITGGKLVSTDVDGGAYWASANNFDGTQTGTLRFKYTPSFTGAPAASGRLFSIGAHGAANTWYCVWNSGLGSTQIIGYNSAGGVAVNATLANWTVTADQEYEICFCWDATNGTTSLFIDGTRLGAEQTTTFTRNAAGDNTYLGNRSSMAAGIIGKYDDVLAYDTCEYTANYTPGYTVPEVSSGYSTCDCWLMFNTGVVASEILTFTATVTETGNDKIKFAANIGGTDYYVTGGVLTASDGYDKTNTAAEVSSNVALFLTARNTIKWKVYLHSDDGSTTPSIDEFTFTYDASLDTDSFSTVDVNFFYYKGNAADNGKVLKYRPYQQGFTVGDSTWISYEWKNFDDAVESDGHATVDLPVNPADTYWEIKLGRQNYIFTLEGQSGVINLMDLTLTKV